MASRKNMNYILLIAAALLLLGSAQLHQADARKFAGVSPFCRTASHRASCTEMVNGAANWHDAVVNAIASTKELAKKLQTLVPLIEPIIADLHPNSRESIRKSCVDNFQNVIDYLDMSVEALNGGDIDMAKSYLSGATASDCTDAMKEFGVGQGFVLTKYSGHLALKVDNCLAVMLQI